MHGTINTNDSSVKQVSPTSSALDVKLTVTLFPDSFALSKQDRTWSLRELAHEIRQTVRRTKQQLPYVKLARFGNKVSGKGCFRRNANVVAFQGVEGDYDAGAVTIEQAALLCREAGLAAAFYPTARHTPASPRWRALSPTSKPLPPEQREFLCAKFQAVLGGVLAPESFILSQGYRYGAVEGQPPCEAVLVEGCAIDELTGWDERALDKHGNRFLQRLRSAPMPPPASDAEPDWDRIDAALPWIPNDDYDDWIKVGMALHYGGTGQDTWDDWSQNSSKYTAEEMDMKWLSFRRGDFEWFNRPVTLGTLYHMAEQHGWKDPGPTRTPEIEDDFISRLPELDEAEPEPPKAGLRLLWLDKLEPVLECSDFVEDLLVESSAVVAFGRHKSGKTFWTTDLALHVASGLEWNGRRVDQGGVVYCVLEGGNKFRNRVVAWRNAFSPDRSLPFAAIAQRLNLCDPKADTSRLIEAIKEAATTIDQPVKLVVIDTLARAMGAGGKDESTTADMNALVANMDRIREETSACVLFVHHGGKDESKGMRGSSALPAAVDTIIEVSRDPKVEGLRIAEVLDQRDLPSGDRFGFRLEVVSLGQNQHGKDVTTCLVRHEEAAEKAKPEPRLSPTLQAALDLLGKMGRDLPDGFGMNEQEWRQACCDDCAVTAASDLKDRQDAVRRVMQKLGQKKRIERRDGKVFLPVPWDPAEAVFEAGDDAQGV